MRVGSWVPRLPFKFHCAPSLAPTTTPDEELALLDDELEEELELLEEELELLLELELDEELFDELPGPEFPPQAVNPSNKPVNRMFFMKYLLSSRYCCFC